jgi:hypothetical protein
MAIGKTGQLFAIRVNKCEKPGAGQDAICLSIGASSIGMTRISACGAFQGDKQGPNVAQVNWTGQPCRLSGDK